MVGNYGNTIAQFFIKYRERGGMSQADLARLLKVTPQYICNVEAGRNPRPIMLISTLMKFLPSQAQSHLEELVAQASWQQAEERIKRERKNGKEKRANSGS